MDRSALIHSDERLDDLQYNGLYIIQHPGKYCFTSDAVMLANFVRGGVKDTVVDLCSGSGVIGILVSEKIRAKHTTLVELQDDLSDMSARSVQYNGLDDRITVVNAPLQGISKKIGQGHSIVVCNPPYKNNNGNILNDKDNIAICRHELTVNLEEIVVEAAKLLKYNGRFYVINKEERLVDILQLCRNNGLEPKKLAIIPSTKGANIIMIEAVKGGKSGVSVQIIPRV